MFTKLLIIRKFEKEELENTDYFFLYPLYTITLQFNAFEVRAVEDFDMTQHLPKQNLPFRWGIHYDAKSEGIIGKISYASRAEVEKSY